MAGEMAQQRPLSEDRGKVGMLTHTKMIIPLFFPFVKGFS